MAARVMRRFHLGDLLSVTSGRMLAPDGRRGWCCCCSTSSRARVVPQKQVRAWADQVAVELVTQHPWMWDVQVPAGDSGLTE